MFRLTEMMKELITPTPAGLRRNPPGPVVIWNLIRRCNLKCKHCYSISGDVDFPGELTTAQVFQVMDDLKKFACPRLFFPAGSLCCVRHISESPSKREEKRFLRRAVYQRGADRPQKHRRHCRHWLRLSRHLDRRHRRRRTTASVASPAASKPLSTVSASRARRASRSACASPLRTTTMPNSAT